MILGATVGAVAGGAAAGTASVLQASACAASGAVVLPVVVRAPWKRLTVSRKRTADRSRLA